MKRDKAVLEFVTVSANRTVLFENDNKEGTWQDCGSGLIKINIDGKTLAAEVLDCGLKLRFTSPSSYKDVELISKHHKEPPIGNLIEYSFTGKEQVQCEKNAKLGGGTQ